MTSDALDDCQIVAAVLDDQPASFEILVGRYQRPLFHVALSRLGKTHLADEAVQEAFLAAYRYLASYQPQYSFRTWLWTILLNQCKLVAERDRRDHRHLVACEGRQVEVERVVDPMASPSQQAERCEEVEQLHGWFADLPELEADALRLRFFGQFKFQEIADAQGCSLATAKNRVRRGLAGLSQRMADDSTTFV